MSGKLIFLDIDGTLVVPGQNTPPDSALRAIRAARAAGNRVLLCSGRNPRMLRELLRFGFDGYIAGSGARVVADGKCIFNGSMPAALAEQALKALREAGVACIAESYECSFCDEDFAQLLEEKRGLRGSEAQRWRRQFTQELGIRPMAERRNEEITKLVLLSRGDAGLRQAYGRLREQLRLTVMGDGRAELVNAELVPYGFSKGTGVRAVADYYGTRTEDTCGYGDSMNDKEMLEAVGHAVVMGNAEDAVKQMAAEVCPAVTEDGLFRSFLLNGLMEA